jgi:hypothetical protein
VKIGITLPTFSPDAAKVLEAAEAAEGLGIDGVFMFDHLWPIGDPSRPSLSLYPMLGAVLARTSSITCGTLVARVGLLPDEVVLAGLQGLARLSRSTPNRLVVTLGTGDKASEPENERLGIAVRTAADRRASVEMIANELVADGIECWIGGGAPATNDMAHRLGLTLNLWDASVDRVAALVAAGYRLTWAGPLPTTVPEAGMRLRQLAAAGASWVIWGWPRSLEAVLESAQAAGLRTGGAHSAD